MKTFALALQFLTRVPVTVAFTATDKQLGQSVLYFPLVGLMMGAVLTAIAVGMNTLPVTLQAAILLSVWVIITGGLHLDGLADSADAWVGAPGDRQKTLAIMKDPAAGPVAVIILILVLLLKWNALLQILSTHNFQPLLISPLLGRTALLLLMLSTPYVRKKGLGEKMKHYVPTMPAQIVVAAVLSGTFFIAGLLPLALMGGVLICLRYAAIQRVGGMTGDLYGAAVELVELSVLLGLAVYE